MKLVQLQHQEFEFEHACAVGLQFGNHFKTGLPCETRVYAAGSRMQGMPLRISPQEAQFLILRHLLTSCHTLSLKRIHNHVTLHRPIGLSPAADHSCKGLVKPKLGAFSPTP